MLLPQMPRRDWVVLITSTLVALLAFGASVVISLVNYTHLKKAKPKPRPRPKYLDIHDMGTFYASPGEMGELIYEELAYDETARFRHAWRVTYREHRAICKPIIFGIINGLPNVYHDSPKEPWRYCDTGEVVHA